MFNLVLQAHHSTETVLIKIINDIRLNYDSGKISVLVLLDLSAAFDTVDHNVLILYRLLKTADLTVVQKTIIDTLHKEGKLQTFIAKEAGCSQSAVSKHVNRKLSGRKKCGRKKCTTNRENRSLMRFVKKNRFKNLGELHKEWTEAGVKASRATTQTCQEIWLQLSSEASYLGLGTETRYQYGTGTYVTVMYRIESERISVVA